MTISGIIDWQGATVSPFFYTHVPKFLDANSEELRHMQPLRDIGRSINADGDNSSNPGQMRLFGQKALTRAVVTVMRDLSPALFNVLSSSHLEKVRNMIYMSSHSWSDGLPLLVACMMTICDSYSEDVPAHPSYPTCPVSFSDKERQQQEADIKFHKREALLESMLTLFLDEKRIKYTEDGCVPAHLLEDAQAIVENAYESAKRKLGEKRQHELDAAWPYRKDKFTLMSELCM
jgi:hypothetical protein